MSFGYGFRNPPVGGEGVIARPQFQSDNYVPGVSGWAIFRDGHAEFRSIVVPPGTGNGATVFIQATTPVALNIGDLWYDTSNGMLLHQWDGVTWGPFQISTGAIANGSIVAALIAANTITAGQIAAGTITATELSTGSVTSIKINAGAITAAKIQAGTIFAGIVDGTTISGAQFLAHGSSGEILIYQGTPASGNLVASISALATTDSFGNTIQAGIAFYSLSGNGGYIVLQNDAITGGQPVIRMGSTAHSGVNAATLELNVDELDIIGPGGGTSAQLALLSTGVFSIAGSIFSNGGTAALPSFIQTDTWHAFTLLLSTVAGTDGNGTTYTPSYQLDAFGNVRLKGVVKAPAGGLPANNTWATIPAAYRPGTNIPTLLCSNAIVGTFAHLVIRPNGNVQFDQALGAGVSMYIDGTINVNGV